MLTFESNDDDGKGKGLTNLRPDHLGEGADELGSCIPVPPHRLLIDHLAYGEPERGLEALYGQRIRTWNPLMRNGGFD